MSFVVLLFRFKDFQAHQGAYHVQINYTQAKAFTFFIHFGVAKPANVDPVVMMALSSQLCN